MSKILRVIEPFFVMELGDTLVLAENGTEYVSEHSESFLKAGDSNEINSSYNSTFKISVSYAKQLIADGFLEEVDEKQKTTGFVNVFDEIDNLINKYSKQLDAIEQDLKGQPGCVKLEKTVVLNNILTVLNHLKNIRK